MAEAPRSRYFILSSCLEEPRSSNAVVSHHPVRPVCNVWSQGVGFLYVRMRLHRTPSCIRGCPMNVNNFKCTFALRIKQFILPPHTSFLCFISVRGKNKHERERGKSFDRLPVSNVSLPGMGR